MGARSVLRLAQDARGEALEDLIARWRDAGATLRTYGEERMALLVERLTSELEGALGSTGALPRSKAADTGTTQDRLLTVRQAAERLGVAPTWVHRHWRTALRDCARPLGTRTLRFSERALEERCRRLQLGKL